MKKKKRFTPTPKQIAAAMEEIRFKAPPCRRRNRIAKAEKRPAGKRIDILVRCHNYEQRQALNLAAMHAGTSLNAWILEVAEFFAENSNPPQEVIDLLDKSDAIRRGRMPDGPGHQ